MVAALSRLTSMRSSVSAPTMPSRPAYTLPIWAVRRAASITPLLLDLTAPGDRALAEALVQAAKPPGGQGT